MVKEQVLSEMYAAYNGDCMDIMTRIKTGSVHFSCYSPPFMGLYHYSSSPQDLSNCASKEEFLQQYEMHVAEIARVTMPGRISAVHVTDVIGNDGELFDFPAEVKKIHKRHGFIHRNTITVWKEPLKVRMRTMVKSLMHKLIIEDATECFTAMPDYVLIFKKKGQNPVPVEHPFGLTHYAGATPFLEMHKNQFGDYETFRKKWLAYDGDPRFNKLSHVTWQRYASSVWDDVRIDNVLPFRDGKDPDDEKHVHPLQLDVVDRLVDMYTNPGEICLTPYAGVGSEMFSPVSMGRRAIGAELKESYFKQLKLNMKEAEKRFNESGQMVMQFDVEESFIDIDMG